MMRMTRGRRPLAPLLSMVFVAAICRSASAEILIRWDQDRIPSPQSLGISTVVLPAANNEVVRDAVRQGYRILLEVSPSALATIKTGEGVVGVVVTGNPSDVQLAQAEKTLARAGVRVLTLDERGKWPHIRTNWVTKNKDILQVTSRTSQPWIENNAALVRIAKASASKPHALLTYAWKPITLADVDEGPALENYLVAIAESGSFGGDLLLPLHAQFQRRLLLGDPQTRMHWDEMRRHIEFYSWSLPDRYRPIASVGVVSSAPEQSYEVMNLLFRHNVPFEVIAPSGLASRKLDAVELLLVLDPLKEPELKTAADFASRGGILVVVQPQGALPWRSGTAAATTDQRASYAFGKGRVLEVLKGISDPNAFALEVRRLLGSDRRVIDIWNGVTVLASPYESPGGDSLLVTAVNFAYQPLSLQIRVKGTFSVVHYESPEEPLALMPYQHRNGYTEFVLPALRIGARVFLTQKSGG